MGLLLNAASKKNSNWIKQKMLIFNIQNGKYVLCNDQPNWTIMNGQHNLHEFCPDLRAVHFTVLFIKSHYFTDPIRMDYVSFAQ
jgi:hypothetical protein